MYSMVGLTHDTKATLERVIEKATILRELSFLSELEKWQITFRKGGVVVTRPSTEAKDAFLLNLRFFIYKNEATSFQGMTKLSKGPTVSSEWKERVLAIRSDYDAVLDESWGTYKYGGQSHKFSNRQIMDTFLHGGWVHANQPQTVARFQERHQYPGTFALLELRFGMTIRTVCRLIFFLSQACQDELNRSHEGSDSSIHPEKGATDAA